MQHLAIIPDGNRRWAKKNLKKVFFGHEEGTRASRIAIDFCLKKGIKYLSFYIFSLENFNRPEEEKKYLFNLLAENFEMELPKFIEQGIKIRFIGQEEMFPEKLRPVIKKIESATKDLKILHINLLFCYGGRQEIIHAAKQIAKKVKAGVLDVDKIDEQSLYSHFWTAGTPDPDLIIRTSKRARLSNYLLFQAAYSEFIFLDCFWPDITEKHLSDCVNQFNSTQRNFGR